MDTREKRPWVFSARVNTIRRGLRFGDYSIDGHEDRMTVERKSLEDYVGTLVTGWFQRRSAREPRFVAELQGLAQMHRAAIVVEADLSAVVRGEYRSRCRPESVLGATAAILAQWGVPVIFAGTRAAAATLAEEFLLRSLPRPSGSPGPSPVPTPARASGNIRLPAPVRPPQGPQPPVG